MQGLPWLKMLLDPVQKEYSLNPPNYSLVNPSFEDIDYIHKQVVPNDPFDKDKLKEYCVRQIQKGKADVLKSVCSHGEILLVSLHESPFYPTWNTWWRAIRLLSKTPVKIVIFGHPKRREVPFDKNTVGPEDVNGGSANRCDAKTIVIYRKEEATRVLIHELLHGSCSDPYYKDTPQIEADTEAWAEMILCGMTAKGQISPWIRFMKQQISWTMRQTNALRKQYNVHGPGDYAWRYITGKLEVWERLGIKIPWNYQSNSLVPSLRFTICEPKNI